MHTMNVRVCISMDLLLRVQFVSSLYPYAVQCTTQMKWRNVNKELYLAMFLMLFWVFLLFAACRSEHESRWAFHFFCFQVCVCARRPTWTFNMQSQKILIIRYNQFNWVFESLFSSCKCGWFLNIKNHPSCPGSDNWLTHLWMIRWILVQFCFMHIIQRGCQCDW